ncbi:ABC transporter permease [Microbacteriaceae bacterium K1510]|nr:ABC transporter permease [Microbacteriaceae bacterium K1510]
MARTSSFRSLLLPAIAVVLLYAVALILVFQYSVRAPIPGSLEPGGFTLGNYAGLGHPLYLSVFLRTLGMCAATAVIVLLIGYPLAFYMVRARYRSVRSLLLLVCIMPLFLGDVPRSYAWILMLGANGAINGALKWLGLIDRPIQMLFTIGGVVVALVHITLPFMTLLLAVGISHIDQQYEKAARSLGADPLRVFLTVTLPLSVPAILAGFMTVFALNFSAYATPIMVGGGKVNMISNVVYQLGIASFNYPFAATLSLVSLVAVLIVVGIVGRASHKIGERYAE